jgi:hypothetical protein
MGFRFYGNRGGVRVSVELYFLCRVIGNVPGLDPGFPSTRANVAPAKKKKLRPNFFSSADPNVWSGKWISFLRESGWVAGWGTSLGRTLFSVQGHRSGSGEVPGISDLPSDRGPCKKKKVRPNFFSSADQNVWSRKWISFLRESGWLAGSFSCRGLGHRPGSSQWDIPIDVGPLTLQRKQPSPRVPPSLPRTGPVLVLPCVTRPCRFWEDSAASLIRPLTS